MDKVVGGADFKYDGTYVYYAGTKETPGQFNAHIYSIAENYGAGIAISYLQYLTGYVNPEMVGSSGSIAKGKEAILEMEPIIEHFWKNWDGKSSY